MKIRISPSGIHLFNRESGLNILLDEINIPPSSWSIAPRQVSVALTNICDLDCPYCFAPKNKLKLEYQSLIKWLEELDTNGCLGVGFGGGEPTLYPRLVELCRYTTRNTKLAVTLTTHSHTLNKSLVTALKGNVHFIRLSMDGIGATYEALRKKPFNNFQNCLELARDISPIGINYVVNSQTFRDLDLAILFAKDVGVTEFLLLPEQPSNKNSGIDTSTFRALKKWVEEYRGNIPLTVSELGAEGLPICNPCEKEKELHSYAHITANGILKKTSFDDEGIEIGHGSIIKAIKKLRN